MISVDFTTYTLCPHPGGMEDTAEVVNHQLSGSRWIKKMHHGSEHHIVNGQNDVQPMSENLKTMIYMCIVYIYIYLYTKTTCQYWFLKPSASNRITL